MQIDLSTIDGDSFHVFEHEIAGEKCFLVYPRKVGVKWDKTNLIYRSSVWNEQGEPVSLSFKKFFNFDEQPDLAYTPFSLTANGGCQLIEKIDGSTLIISKYKGELIVRTRGTVNARRMEKNGHEVDQLLAKYPLLVNDSAKTWDYSLICEWVSPLNQIVVSYQEADLYLIGCVHHREYNLLSQFSLDKMAQFLKVKRPQVFNFNSIKEMVDAVEKLEGQEGLCVYCNHGQDIRKIKSAKYLAAHRMKSELASLDRVIDMFFAMNCPTYQTFYDYVANNFDFELVEGAKGFISKVCESYREVESIVSHMKTFVEPLKTKTRKEAALTIQGAYSVSNRSGMVFKLLDSKSLDSNDLKKLIYQVLKN